MVCQYPCQTAKKKEGEKYSIWDIKQKEINILNTLHKRLNKNTNIVEDDATLKGPVESSPIVASSKP